MCFVIARQLSSVLFLVCYDFSLYVLACKGPSIKYVMLEGGGGPRRCDGLWHGGGGQEHVTSCLWKFLSYIWNMNLRWCLTFCCNRCIVTDVLWQKGEWTKTNPDNPPGQKPSRTIDIEFVQGTFVGNFFTRPTKNWGGSEMCDVLSGGPGMCDKVWQGGGGVKIDQK